MPLSKQTIANRKNAQKSTGPITDQGKAMVAQNAVTHGLHSTRIVIESPHYSEDPKEYQTLLASLIWELEPDGVFEHHLVHKIANAMWRYRRVIRAETGSLESNLSRLDNRDFARLADRPDLDSEQGRETYRAELARRRTNFINSSQLPADSESVRLLRYELRLDRQLTRAHRLLNQIQYRRRRQQAVEERERKEKKG
ncbi:MAG: hypothetical protein RBT76_05400 [candidate division Zixibacteria bacterium]|jgi:hypothetical protein|nr:hypothetical protein [candidate division Zixibacteria bacterium]